MHEFRAAVERGGIESAIDLLSDDVVFRSPVVFKPYVGREAVGHVLSAVGRVFEDFRYVRELAAGDDHALVFETRVGDRTVEGCDFVHTGPDGKIDELTVMLRPMSGLLAVAEAMQAELERGAAA